MKTIPNLPTLILSGPTASGKTKFSILIAETLSQKLNIKAEIINFDSLCFYKEISIGTAKPKLSEMNNVKHHLVGDQSIKSPLNAADFCKLAEPIVDRLRSDNVVPILVGGSAFYIRALIKGMYESGDIDLEARSQVETILKSGGIESLRNNLKNVDLKSFEKIHENDEYRNSRALEYFLSTGKKFSEQEELFKENRPYDFSRNIRHSWSPIYHFFLNPPKEEHWKIIERRTKQMWNEGLLDEVKGLFSNGFIGNEKPLQSIGYKETIEFINGEFANEDECIERISISTRQLAKAQRTFFKKIEPKEEFNPITEESRILSTVVDKFNTKF